MLGFAVNVFVFILDDLIFLLKLVRIEVEILIDHGCRWKLVKARRIAVVVSPYHWHLHLRLIQTRVHVFLFHLFKEFSFLFFLFFLLFDWLHPHFLVDLLLQT